MIVKYPDKILTTPSSDVSLQEGQKIVELLKEEKKTINWGSVVGLAAPQIGINKKVFMCLDKYYLNAKITWYSPEKEVYEEGCYSLKENKFDYKIKRSKNIKMEWQDYKGKARQGTFMGFQAQVLQHEYDHLLGKVCCG